MGHPPVKQCEYLEAFGIFILPLPMIRVLPKSLLPQGKASDAAFAALIGAADATTIEEDDEPISDDSDAEA